MSVAPGVSAPLTGVERAGDVLRVRGPVVMANVEGLLQEGRARMQGAGSVVVDLSGVTEVDSSSISMLLQWLREAATRGHTLRVTGVPENMRSLATLYGVDELLPYQQSNASA